MAEPRRIGDLVQRPNPVQTSPEREAIDYVNEAECDAYLAEKFPGIHPTPRDYFFGKIRAYEIAVERADAIRKQEIQRRKVEQLKAMWTFDEMWDAAYSYGKSIGQTEGFEFVIDDANRQAFELLCLYFTNDKRFEDYDFMGVKYDLNKGLWLQSGVRGSGKSVLLRCFTLNKRACLAYKHTSELANLYSRNGYPAIDPFTKPLPLSPSPINFYQDQAAIIYDELFGESKANYMGNPLNISEYIINALYDFSNGQRGKKYLSHCTSNCDGSEIEQKSGKNYRSRMADMFNLIKLDGPDRRINRKQ